MAYEINRPGFGSYDPVSTHDHQVSALNTILGSAVDFSRLSMKTLFYLV